MVRRPKNYSCEYNFQQIHRSASSNEIDARSMSAKRKPHFRRVQSIFLCLGFRLLRLLRLFRSSRSTFLVKSFRHEASFGDGTEERREEERCISWRESSMDGLEAARLSGSRNCLTHFCEQVYACAASTVTVIGQTSSSHAGMIFLRTDRPTERPTACFASNTYS